MPLQQQSSEHCRVVDEITRVPANRRMQNRVSWAAACEGRIEISTTLLRQIEIDGDAGLNFDRLAVKQVRLVLPLFDGLHGSSA